MHRVKLMRIDIPLDSLKYFITCKMEALTQLRLLNFFKVLSLINLIGCLPIICEDNAAI